jgi:hypothetical protein
VSSISAEQTAQGCSVSTVGPTGVSERMYFDNMATYAAMGLLPS